MLKDVFEKYSKDGYFLIAVCYKKEDAQLLLINSKRIMKEHHEIYYVFEIRK